MLSKFAKKLPKYVEKNLNAVKITKFFYKLSKYEFCKSIQKFKIFKLLLPLKNTTTVKSIPTIYTYYFIFTKK